MIFGISPNYRPRTRSEESIMRKIVIDSYLRSILQGVNQPAELCDESGRVLGHFVPTGDLSQYEPRGPQVSDEELERRSKAEEKCYTTAEVLAYLEQL
jgi:hypothetical protein